MFVPVRGSVVIAVAPLRRYVWIEMLGVDAECGRFPCRAGWHREAIERSEHRRDGAHRRRGFHHKHRGCEYHDTLCGRSLVGQPG